MQSNIRTYYRLRKREPLIPLGALNFCIRSTPPWGGVADFNTFALRQWSKTAESPFTYSTRIELSGIFHYPIPARGNRKTNTITCHLFYHLELENLDVDFLLHQNVGSMENLSHTCLNNQWAHHKRFGVKDLMFLLSQDFTCNVQPILTKRALKAWHLCEWQYYYFVVVVVGLYL